MKSHRISYTGRLSRLTSGRPLTGLLIARDVLPLLDGHGINGALGCRHDAIPSSYKGDGNHTHRSLLHSMPPHSRREGIYWWTHITARRLRWKNILHHSSHLLDYHRTYLTEMVRERECYHTLLKHIMIVIVTLEVAVDRWDSHLHPHLIQCIMRMEEKGRVYA